MTAETALALPEPEEGSSALALVSAARQALEEAKTLPEMKDLRNWSLALAAYVKGRGMDVVVENAAAELILRTERKAGAELIRMAKAGERATGDNLIPGAYQTPSELQVAPPRGPTLKELNIDRTQAFYWQRVAALEPEDFEERLEDAKSHFERIARVNFYREPKIRRGEPGYPADPWVDRWHDLLAEWRPDTAQHLPTDVIQAIGQDCARLTGDLRAELTRRGG